MQTSKPTLSTTDFSRLMPLVVTPAPRIARAVLERLDERLANASLVAPETIGPDIVTMNSKVVLSSPAWQGPREYRLVYPTQRAAESGELSVLSALGTELLGARAGARISLGDGPGDRAVELLSLTYQPEAAGDWDL
jgi:regulator of nucleoside diphosphate kinase